MSIGNVASATLFAPPWESHCLLLEICIGLIQKTESWSVTLLVIFMNSILWYWLSNVSNIISGCIGYFAIMSSFLWLLIINYNLWKTFQKIGVAIENRFVEYNIFVWSGTSILFTITISAETIGLWTPALVNSKTAPNFINLYCWINSTTIILIFLFRLITVSIKLTDGRARFTITGLCLFWSRSISSSS